MRSDLQKAKKLGGLIRYKQDTPQDTRRLESKQSDEAARNHFYRTGLLIDEISAPVIEKCLQVVCDRLFLPRSSVTAFVYASSEMQAAILSFMSEECIIQISSGLISLLSERELKFVLGHELGHFLLGHCALQRDNESVESFMLQRAQEISVDRIGLVGCGNLNVAMSALIKTISGLDEKHLGFDVGQFISQVRKISNPNRGENFNNSHPSLVVRCRALLWFSTASIVELIEEQNFDFDLSAIDDRVQNEIDKFVDGPAKKRIEKIAKDVELWHVAQLVLEDGIFQKVEQKKFKERFGEKTLVKLKNLLNDLSKEDALKFIQDRSVESQHMLKNLIPQTFDSKYASILAEVESNFRQIIEPAQ